MTQSTRTNDESGRFTAEDYRAAQQLKSTGMAGRRLPAPSAEIIRAALRIASRVSEEPDEAMVEQLIGDAYRNYDEPVHHDTTKAVIAAYRQRVMEE